MIKRLLQFLSRLTKNVPEGHKYFKGTYHKGTAECFYIPMDGERIFDGEFKFKMKMGGGMYHLAEGEYERDRKTGEWYFERKGEKTFKRMTISFERGHFVGDVDFMKEDVALGSEVTTTLLLHVEHGKVTGKLTGHLDGGDFIGFCDDDGYPDGTWTVTVKENGRVDLIKKEVWNHGVLTESSVENPHKKQKTLMNVILREKVNTILRDDIAQLLHIVRRGTVDHTVSIPSK